MFANVIDKIIAAINRIFFKVGIVYIRRGKGPPARKAEKVGLLACPLVISFGPLPSMQD